MHERLTRTVPEAAKILGVPKSTLYDIIRREEFPAMRLGRRTLVRVADLEQWLGRKLEEERQTA